MGGIWHKAGQLLQEEKMPITREVMQQMHVFAESIAETIDGYENNDFCDENDKDHVLRWASQFDEVDQLFVLQQTDTLLKRQYFNKDKYDLLLNKAIRETTRQTLLDTSFRYSNRW